MIDNGLGKSIYTNTSDAIISFEEGEYTARICWAVGVFLIKCSILAFYWRIFSDVKNARISILVLLGATLCWGIAVVSLWSPFADGRSY